MTAASLPSALTRRLDARISPPAPSTNFAPTPKRSLPPTVKVPPPVQSVSGATEAICGGGATVSVAGSDWQPAGSGLETTTA